MTSMNYYTKTLILILFFLISISASAQKMPFGTYWCLPGEDISPGGQSSLIDGAVHMYEGNGVKEDKAKAIMLLEFAFDEFQGERKQYFIALLCSYLDKYTISPECALAFIETAHNKGIQNALLSYREGKIYRKLGRNEEAMAAYDKCIALDPTYTNGYIGKSGLYYSIANTYAQKNEDNKDVSQQQFILESLLKNLQMGVDADEKALATVKSEITKASIERRLANNRQKIHDVTYKIQSITGPKKPQATAQQQETNIAKEAPVDNAVSNVSSVESVTVNESPNNEDAIAAEAPESSKDIQNVETNSEISKTEATAVPSNVSTEKPHNVEQMIVEKQQPETVEPSTSKSGKKARIEQSIGVSTAQLWDYYAVIEYDSKGDPWSFTGINDKRILFLPGYSIGCRLPIGLYFGALLEGTYIKPFEYNGPGYLRADECIERGEFQLIFCLEANYMLTVFKSVYPFVTAGIGLNVVGAKGINPIYLKAGVRVPLGLKNGIDIGVGFLDMFDKSLTFSVAYSF